MALILSFTPSGNTILFYLGEDPFQPQDYAPRKTISKDLTVIESLELPTSLRMSDS
jgi:hypothetical protein